MTVGGPGQTSNAVALLISHLKISYRTGSVCCEKLACKCPQNSIKRSSSPAVTLATPHKKTCHHRSMRESERVTAFMECRLLSTPGNRTVLFFWHGAAHEEAPRCRCVASHVWWVCWMQLHFKDHRWLFFFFFFLQLQSQGGLQRGSCGRLPYRDGWKRASCVLIGHDGGHL